MEAANLDGASDFDVGSDTRVGEAHDGERPTASCDADCDADCARGECGRHADSAQADRCETYYEADSAAYCGCDYYYYYYYYYCY